jgi:hypothetical protein
MGKERVSGVCLLFETFDLTVYELPGGALAPFKHDNVCFATSCL